MRYWFGDKNGFSRHRERHSGLSFALKAAKCGSVAIVTKREPKESATLYAQGGIASVFSKEDSFDLPYRGHLRAGAGLCKPDIVELVVKHGPESIKELIELGAAFTKKKAKGGRDDARPRHGGRPLGKEDRPRRGYYGQRG